MSSGYLGDCHCDQDCKGSTLAALKLLSFISILAVSLTSVPGTCHCSRTVSSVHPDCVHDFRVASVFIEPYCLMSWHELADMYRTRKVHTCLLLITVIMAQYATAASKIAGSRTKPFLVSAKKSTNEVACRKVGSYLATVTWLLHEHMLSTKHLAIPTFAFSALQVRFATFNASLNRDKAGQLLQELQTNSSLQAAQGKCLGL